MEEIVDLDRESLDSQLSCEEGSSNSTTRMSPKCLICDKEFCGTATMLRHMRNVHKEKTDYLLSRRSKILCCICPAEDDAFSCKNLLELQRHMENQHNIQFKLERYQFKSEAEFMEWKSTVEKENISRYVKSSGPKRKADIKKTYFYCSRSGFYRPKGTNKHALKLQGSSKINNTCPSYMCAVTTVTGDGTQVDVEYVSTHVGHKTELGYLPLNKKDRDLLSSKIAQGMDFNSILNSVRETYDGKLQRIHLTTKKDLLNIKASKKKRSSVAKNAVNRFSVETWVEQMKSMISEENGDAITGNQEHIILYCDEQGNILQTEINSAVHNVEAVTIEDTTDIPADTLCETRSVEVKSGLMEKLRTQLIKEAELAIMKFKQAETLIQLVAMQKVFKTVNPSLDALLKKSQES